MGLYTNRYIPNVVRSVRPNGKNQSGFIFRTNDNEGKLTYTNDKFVFEYNNGTEITLNEYGVVENNIVTVNVDTQSVDVTDAKIVKVEGTGTVTLNGFSGGVTGQILHIINTSTNNLIILSESTGTQQLKNGATNVTVYGYGGLTLVFDGTYWYGTGYWG